MATRPDPGRGATPATRQLGSRVHVGDRLASHVESSFRFAGGGGWNKSLTIRRAATARTETRTSNDLSYCCGTDRDIDQSLVLHYSLQKFREKFGSTLIFLIAIKNENFIDSSKFKIIVPNISQIINYRALITTTVNSVPVLKFQKPGIFLKQMVSKEIFPCSPSPLRDSRRTSLSNEEFL